MKRERYSIKWQVFSWLAVMIVVILLVSGFFSLLFSAELYKSAKMMGLDDDMQDISKTISGRSFSNDCINSVAWCDEVERYCAQSYNAIVVRNLTTGESYSQNMLPHDSELEDPAFCDNLINLAKQNGGNYVLADNRGGVNSVYVTRLVNATDGQVAIMMNTSVNPTETFIVSSRWIFIGTSITIFIAIFILGTIAMRRIVRPISHISDSSKNIIEGKFSHEQGKRGNYKEINQLNASLSAAAKEISKTETFQKELIANISHDLRTPLTIISGYAEMMKDFKDADHTDSIEGILNETRRMSELVNDILDLSQIESGALYRDENMNLTNCILEAIARFAPLKEQGYEIVFSPSSEVYIKADQKRIMQVIYNFIANAINYGGSDKMVYVDQQIVPGGVKVSVRDNGEGIPEASIKDIWQRYFKIDKEHRRAGKGTGLGLTIVKGILENYGAEYGVDSKVGEGSTFWFVFKPANQ